MRDQLDSASRRMAPVYVLTAETFAERAMWKPSRLLQHRLGENAPVLS